MTDRFEVTCEVTRNDWLSVNETLMRISPHWGVMAQQYRRAALRKMLWWSPLIVGGTSLAIGRQSSTSGMYGEGALVGIVFAFLITFGLSRLDVTTRSKRVQMDRIRRMDLGGAIGSHTFSLDERGVEIKTPVREMKLTWPAITAHDVGEYVLFSHGGNDGSILPKRAFASPDEAAECVRRAIEWWQMGQFPIGQRIARYLADRDVACPRCQYNLRASAGEVCPECGEVLSLEKLMQARQ